MYFFRSEVKNLVSNIKSSKPSKDDLLLFKHEKRFKESVSESLAGKVGIIPMQGLSISELNKFQTNHIDVWCVDFPNDVTMDCDSFFLDQK